MAIISFISDIAKGHNGQYTYSARKNAKGTYVTRRSVRPSIVDNPKTYQQTVNRAMFATAVKFYKRATKNFYRFAFEDQHANETDYNAFMRHNKVAALPMNKYQIAAEMYAAIGNHWQLSQGSIRPLTVTFDEGAGAWDLGVGLSGENRGSTVGNMSRALIKLGYQAGDIVTLVMVYGHVELSDYEYMDQDAVKNRAAAHSEVPLWAVQQFIVEPANTSFLDASAYVGKNILSGKLIGAASADDNLSLLQENSTEAQALAVVITRKKGRRLYATTSYLKGNKVWNDIVSYMGSAAYTVKMLTSWGANVSQAILQGSLTTPETELLADPVVSRVNGNTIPAIQQIDATAGSIALELTGENFGSERDFTENSFALSTSSASVKSLTIKSSTSATLEIEYPANAEVGVYLGDDTSTGTLLVTLYSDTEETTT